MRWAITLIGSGVCAFCGYGISHQGDLWLGLLVIATGAVFILEADRHQPVEVVTRNTLARWRQSPAFNPDSNLEG